MMTKKIDYTVVGFFVLAMGFALAVAIVQLSGRTGATDAYHAVYRNVTGVKYGSQVLYEGYPIGQVEDVTPVPVDGGMRFRVDFAVTQGWKIPEDSTAQIRAPGLLSAITVSIDAGSSATPLRPGAEVRSKEAANLFATISSVAGDISGLAEHSLKPLLANLDRTVTVLGDLVERDGQRLVREAIVMIEELNRRIPRIADDIESFSADISQASGELRTLLAPANRLALEETLANLNRATRQIEHLVTSTEAMIHNLDGVVSNTDGLVADARGVVVENREQINAAVTDLRYLTDSVSRHIDAINRNLEGAARNLYEFSRQIRQNPGLLLGGTPPRDQARIP